MSQAQTVKTLVHEIAHASCMTRPRYCRKNKRRGGKEVEAESVAYGMSAFWYRYFGLFLWHVAGWSREDLSELKASLDTIHSTAGEIIAALESNCLERQIPAQPTPKKRHYEYQH